MTLNSRGQIAIFVALVFQILFLFFAMVINIGLLVHHKINLQNSVDIAAYYGAGKQAETMNAIAHVNYQIRQAYKLLTFRYWSLGTAGDEKFRAAVAGGSPLPEEQTDMQGHFCIGYQPWNFVAKNESYCKDQTSFQRTRLPPNVPVSMANGLVNPFFAFQSSVNATISATREQIKTNCRDILNTNYYVLARFIFAWKWDVRNRRKLVMQLANELSDVKGGKDIDGQSITTGVENTLKNNLTSANRENIKFQMYNSLGNSQCGPTGSEFEPPKWLKEIFILHYMTYLDANCNVEDAIQWKPAFINSAFPPAAGYPSGRPMAKAENEDLNKNVDALAPYMDEPPGTDPQANMYKSMVGFEKNPWCMAYFGVSAQSEPKIPFSPFGTVKLTARAFAKPFGGSIGPWHKAGWSPQSAFSDLGEEVDKVMPPRHINGQTIGTPAVPNSSANYSRYVGDRNGFASKMGLWDFARSMFGNAKVDINSFNIAQWNHLYNPNYDFDVIGTEGDVLSWMYPDSKAAGTPPVGNWRDLEIASVSPNQFDIAYYSIEPDFYKNYLYRWIQNRENKDFKFNVRGDYGSKRNVTDNTFLEYSVKHQIRSLEPQNQQKPAIDVNVQTYFVRKFDELLTWFQSRTTETHELDPLRFGQCKYPVPDTAQPSETTTGNCVAGGRTGYSVKIVDGNYLRKGNLRLGGDAAPDGPLKNPWSDSDLPPQ